MQRTLWLEKDVVFTQNGVKLLFVKGFFFMNLFISFPDFNPTLKNCRNEQFMIIIVLENGDLHCRRTDDHHVNDVNRTQNQVSLPTNVYEQSLVV